jgi:1-phosphatidylinositol-4-phosphate 5-kinase
LKSLSLKRNRDRIFKAGQGSGASGSFFFFSYDKKFIIKTLKGSEKKILLGMLDDLIHHFVVNRNSLIARIYGIFTIKSNVFAPLDLIVMQNTARHQFKKSLTLEFDLKGSTNNRKVMVEQHFWRK